MGAIISPFRVTTEDLQDLDKKTQEGLQPLIEALNKTFQETIAAVANLPDEEVVQVTLTTGATVADSFPLKFKTVIGQPRFISMSIKCRDTAHALTTAFALQSWDLVGSGMVSVRSITGLAANNTYDLAFLVKP